MGGYRIRPPGPLAEEWGQRTGIALLAAWLANWSLLVFTRRSAIIIPVEQLAFEPVTLWTTVAVGGAGVLHRVTKRRSASPDRRFVQIVVPVLLASMLLTSLHLATTQAAPLGAVLLVSSMHIVVVGICILVFTGYRPRHV